MALPIDIGVELAAIYEEAKGKKHGDTQVAILVGLAVMEKLDILQATVNANSVNPILEWPLTP